MSRPQQAASISKRLVRPWCQVQLVEARLKRVYLEGQAARAEGQTMGSLVATAAAAAPVPAAVVAPPSPLNGLADKADEADANMVALLAAERRSDAPNQLQTCSQ